MEKSPLANLSVIWVISRKKSDSEFKILFYSIFCQVVEENELDEHSDFKPSFPKGDPARFNSEFMLEYTPPEDLRKQSLQVSSFLTHFFAYFIFYKLYILFIFKFFKRKT